MLPEINDMYTEEFKSLVKNGVKDGFYIGLGNPNADILLVGKEAAINSSSEFEIQNQRNYYNNAIDWQENIDTGTKTVSNDWDFNSYIQDSKATNNPLFAFKGALIKEQGKTWRKYQKLYDCIFGRENGLVTYGHDFQKKFFITEMSDNPVKSTNEAKHNLDFKEKLQNRKETFFKSTFIEQFPIIILACSDYIWNLGKDENRQIDTLFGVEYSHCYTTKTTKRPQSFYIHLNSNKSKLVIHTNQLSGSNASNELLVEMGKFIKEFQKKQLTNIKRQQHLSPN